MRSYLERDRPSATMKVGLWPAHLHRSGGLIALALAVVLGLSSFGTEGEALPPETPSGATRHSSELWLLDGGYYDFRPLMSWHPGTALPLERTMGTDVSVLFRVQHLSERPRSQLHKYALPRNLVRGTIEPLEYSYSFEPGGFYATVKARVNEYLADAGVQKPRQASRGILAKLGFNALLFAGTWSHLVLAPFSPVAYPAACVLNLVSRAVLTGLAHDALHGNLLPQYPKVQESLVRLAFRGFLLFWEGEWYHEHVVFHHPHTKTLIDPDENIHQLSPFWRLTDKTLWTPLHAYPILSTAITGLILLEVHLIIRFGAPMIACWIFFHWLPVLVRRDKRKALLTVFVASKLTTLVALLAFHANHLFLEADLGYSEYRSGGTDWGAHQLRTTANFNTDFISGTLDLQIEHHLFPMLSYDNQQSVQPIIRRTAEEFALPYHAYSSFTAAVLAHLSYMVDLGRGPVGAGDLVPAQQGADCATANWSDVTNMEVW